MTRIRVLLAEDHETVRHALKLLIDGDRGMTVVGEARDGREVIARARGLAPDVVVLDISMPGMNGLEATKALHASTPAPAIVALTRYRDEAYVRALLAAGAAGYVLKQSPSGELLRAIRAAAEGQRYLDAAIASNAMAPARERAEQRPAITDREGEVLRMTALGHSNKEIAAALDLSVKTVEVHKANAMRKLGLRGRIDVVRFAILQGWLQEP